MSDKSAIEWTDATWNPVRGCSRVSEGCRNCYAERMAGRFSGPGLWAEGIVNATPAGPRWTGRVELVEGKLGEPLRWKTPRRVFVNSMSDLFHEGLSNQAIAAVFGVMAASPRHTFQVLTKRPERMREWFLWMREFAMGQRDIASAPSLRQTTVKAAFSAMWETDTAKRKLDPHWAGDGDLGPWPLPNVWLGVSVEDQDTADGRIPLLLDTPAAVRFVSAEPLLGPVDLTRLHYEGMVNIDALNGRHGVALPLGGENARLDWVIVGGESGPGARPMQRAWARHLRDQCEAAGVAFFFKQWGEHAPNWHNDNDGREIPGSDWVDRMGKHAAGRLLDGREHNAFPGGAV